MNLNNISPSPRGRRQRVLYVGALVAVLLTTVLPLEAAAAGPSLAAPLAPADLPTPAAARNPVLIQSGHVGATPAYRAKPNSLVSAGSVAEPGYKPPPSPPPPPPGPVGPRVVTVPSMRPRPMFDQPQPLISNVTQFTSPSTGGYGTPPDNGVATDGYNVGSIYNGNPGIGQGEIINFTTATGAEEVAYGQCGIEGYQGCSDPNIRYDQSAGRWIFTYIAFPSPFNNNGGIVALGVSNDSSPYDGFSIYGLGKVDSGGYDAPRVGISSDKVVITNNYGSSTCNAYSTCTLIYVIDKAQLYSLQGFNFHEYQGLGKNYQPVTSTTHEGTTLFEAPDFSTPNSGIMVTHYVSGPEGSETFTTDSWGIGNVAQGQFEAPQPGTPYTLSADSSEFESAVYTSNVVWVTGNDMCSNSSQLCPRFVSFNVDSYGQPITLNSSFIIGIGDGSDLFYTALSPTVNSTSVLGVTDYTCAVCGEYASVGTFELTTSGNYTGGAYAAGNSIISPAAGHADQRWGDVNGCGFVPGTSPAQATCIGQFASNGSSASEILTVGS